MIDRVSYTYLIGWPDLDKWYYGSRSAKDCHPCELFNSKYKKSYETSSKIVTQFMVDNGTPPLVRIHKIFDDVESCRDYENLVLKKLRVRFKDKWLNKTDNRSWDGMLGKTFSETTKLKMAKSRSMRAGLPGPATGKVWDEARRRKHAAGRANSTKRIGGEPGLIRIMKDGINKSIHRDFLDEYLENGWARGIHRDNAYLQVSNRDPEKIRKTAATNTGKKRSDQQKLNMSEARMKVLERKST